MSVTINGALLVGGVERRRDPGFQAVDAASGEQLPGSFGEATPQDVADACAMAADTAPAFAKLPPTTRAVFLEMIAERIEQIGDILIGTAMAETGLSRARLENERGRTVVQLRMFANELRDGRWLDATIDLALTDRAPPRPDVRRINVPLGPVAVFGASNFPLAFSVAGGDTASALAAGCPVVVKGHPAHPGTGELVARAIGKAVVAAALPKGIFSYLPGRSNALGAALVGDPRIKAVGFTGSRGGGLALARIAAARPEPIPVYAEMSSINPVVLLPAALAGDIDALASAFVASLTLGAGQFCTNPGIVLALSGPDLDRFATAAAAELRRAAPQTMLTQRICQDFRTSVDQLRNHAEVETLAVAQAGVQCGGALFSVDARAFLADRRLADEVFGASSLIVRCADIEQLVAVIAGLDGQLTGSVFMGQGDERLAAHVLPVLAERAGRVLVNGWPTGVEVTRAMVHGGPFPATSDGRSTSVGTLAMARFLRPVCWQNIPDALLPDGLRDVNPWGIPRRVDGEWRTG